MSREVDVVWMPGLCSTWIDLGLMPQLGHAATARATLRGAFPNVPAVVEATLLSGLAPSLHGRLGEAILPGREPPRPGVLGTWPEVRLHRRTALWSALRREGFPCTAAHDALRAADAEWATSASQANEDHVVLVCGGPSFRPHARERRIDLSHLSGLDAVAEGGILRVTAEENRRAALREHLLRTAGVERVLTGGGLRLWGADHPQAGDLVAVAEPDWSFTEEAVTYGSLEEAPAAPLVLVFGGSPRWPDDVHDVRIAPTVARYLGRDVDGFADTPLDL